MDSIIYGLEDPRDHLYHYIGITEDVYTRFIQHITGDGRNVEKNGWIWECRRDNVMIIMREIQRLETIEEAQKRERFWVAYYLQAGHPLHNLSIAKGIEAEKALLERKRERIESHLKELALVRKMERESLDLQLVADAWNDGHQSIDKIAAALGISPWQARTHTAKARAHGLIGGKNHTHTQEEVNA